MTETNETSCNTDHTAAAHPRTTAAHDRTYEKIAIFSSKTESPSVLHARTFAQGKALEFAAVEKSKKSAFTGAIAKRATGMSPYRKRLELNKESASVSRIRRVNYVERLEAMIEENEAKRDELQRVSLELRNEFLALSHKLENEFLE
mmetsp:Transcript_27224/g.68293  ORF Transcript_27224/g.68293 Transcript_27224/m.68293 type:complete len:147 (-) Transcript_27224:351-791(-)